MKTHFLSSLSEYLICAFPIVLFLKLNSTFRHLKKQILKFHAQMTVHRDNFRINNQQDASSIQKFILSRNFKCFGHLLCPSSGVISCARGNWYVSFRLCGLGESGWTWNSNLTLLGSGHITCMKHTICHLYS
jgi:hypothetical protein